MNCLATTLTCTFSLPRSAKPIRERYERENTCLVLASLLTARNRLPFECLNAPFDLVSKIPGLCDLVVQQRKVLTGSVHDV